LPHPLADGAGRDPELLSRLVHRTLLGIAMPRAQRIDQAIQCQGLEGGPERRHVHPAVTRNAERRTELADERDRGLREGLFDGRQIARLRLLHARAGAFAGWVTSMA